MKLVHFNPHLHAMKLSSLAALLLLHWSQKIESAVASLNERGDGGTIAQSSGPNLGLTVSTGRAVTSGNAAFTAYMDKLIESKRQLDLLMLETILRKSREFAGNDPILINDHYFRASFMIKSCPAPETVVQQAFDAQYYEILHCLAHCPSWKSEAQRHLFWAKLYKAGIVEQAFWDQQQFQWDGFFMMVLKADNAELYEVLRQESFKELARNDLRVYIMALDAANILSRSYPDMAREIIENIDLIGEHKPARIINQIIPPHAVKSAINLQKLFNAGYTRVPKSCLQSGTVPAVHTRCIEWLIENNCLSLLTEMFQAHPDSNHDYYDYCTNAIYEKSLDTAKWLMRNSNLKIPLTDLMIVALRTGHLETIEWLYINYKDRMDWSNVLCNSYQEIVLYDTITQFLKKETNLAPPHGVNLELLFLAAEGNLEGLKAAPPNTSPTWVQTANIAAVRGNEEILKWVDFESQVLPSSCTVEDSYKRGQYSALHYIFKVEPTLIVPGYKSGYISASRCLLYATMQNNQEEMEWIWANPLKNEQLTLLDVYYSPPSFIPEETLLRVFNQIETDMTAIDPIILENVIYWDHAQVFRWLYGKGLYITEEIVKTAIRMDGIKIARMVHKIKPSLLCSKEVSDEVEKLDSVWKDNFLDLIKGAC